MHLAGLGLHDALSPAGRTSDVRQAGRGDLARPLDLNHPAEPLSQSVGRQFDLIVVRRPRPLLQRLYLGRHCGSLSEQILELLHFSYGPFLKSWATAKADMHPLGGVRWSPVDLNPSPWYAFPISWHWGRLAGEFAVASRKASRP